MENILYKDTIPFIPPITSGKVIKVYDGDTITIASKLPYENSLIYRFSVRIKGIDCPEIRTHNLDEKEIALIAKNFVQDKCLNKIVELKNLSTEKYGRILADVFVEDINIGNELIKNKLSVPYNGGKKLVPDNWKIYYNN
jgi:micrococcal nuclease